MRKSHWLAVAAVLVATPVVAAPALRSVMRNWRDDARTMHDMATGRTGFDAAAVRTALQGYVADSKRVESEITGHSAEANDVRRRFAAFEADARTALENVSDRSALSASVTKLLSHCRSCHDIYNK